jgi:hypothetical protein
VILIAGAVVAVVLFFVFRGDDNGGSQAQTTAPTPATTTSNAPEPPPMVFRINTKVPGIKRVEVKQDRRVTIIVVVDRTQEVHIHGYDLKATMTPERPGGFSFRADEPGRFEIEFEGSGQQIAELTVSP